jgi:hypothetical protein
VLEFIKASDVMVAKMRLRRVAITATFLAVIAPVIGWSEQTGPAVLRGAVRKQLAIDEALLKSLPSVTVAVTFEGGQGKKCGSYTGVLLWALLEKAALVDEPGKNASLKHSLLITGLDGYAVALAIGEIDPHYEGKRVIVAYAGGDPAASTSALRLIVPGDAHGGRSVRDVATIEVK